MDTRRTLTVASTTPPWPSLAPDSGGPDPSGTIRMVASPAGAKRIWSTQGISVLAELMVATSANVRPRTRQCIFISDLQGDEGTATRNEPAASMIPRTAPPTNSGSDLAPALDHIQGVQANLRPQTAGCAAF